MLWPDGYNRRNWSTIYVELTESGVADFLYRIFVFLDALAQTNTHNTSSNEINALPLNILVSTKHKEGTYYASNYATNYHSHRGTQGGSEYPSIKQKCDQMEKIVQI
jgi:hypothetical protein